MATRQRYYQIDLLRFFAAIIVVFYHYCFRGYAKDDFSPLEFNDLAIFSKYGYLGVDLFFMISGFVILLSVTQSNIISFVISRISRLYPAYWVCLVLTTVIMLVWGNTLFQVDLFTFLTNLTMLNGFFGIDNIDGVYWSLLVELKFYFLMGVLLLLGMLRHLLKFITIWLALSIGFLFVSTIKGNPVISVLNYVFILKYAPHFISGMLFFIIYKEGFNLKKGLLLALSFIASLGNAKITVDYVNGWHSIEFSYVTACGIITSFYVFFYLMVTHKLNILNKPFFLKLGLMTYPLYLLHQNIGYITFTNFNGMANKYVILGTTILLMLFISYQISIRIEKPLGRYMKRKMENSLLAKWASLRLKASRS